MAKNIKYLGRVKLPFDKILNVINLKSTKVNTTNDTEDTAHVMGRNKEQLAFSKMILKLYTPKKNIANFFRYTNKALSDMIPKSFWKKYKMDKATCRIAIMRHPPGTVSIPHIDRYYNAVKELGKKGLDTNRIRRLWIPLTEPKLGHALFVGNEVAYALKRGTVITFNKDVPHSGCNVGYEDRYVLTLTGYYG
jgi:hypothetical protein|tara:strand:- start:5337 stop:5915 length:579 start_codon:yes stop_codon:yes gene_type:complete